LIDILVAAMQTAPPSMEPGSPVTGPWTTVAAGPVPHMPRTSLVVRVYSVSNLPVRDRLESTCAGARAGIERRVPHTGEQILELVA